jgi:hypothetical protein
LPQPKRPTDPPSDPPTAVVLDLQGFDGEEVNGGEVGTMAATRPPPTPSPILLQRVWILEEQGGLDPRPCSPESGTEEVKLWIRGALAGGIS